LHTKQDTSNIPRDFGEGQHHVLLFVDSDGWFSGIAVPTVWHQSLKHSQIHRVLVGYWGMNIARSHVHNKLILDIQCIINQQMNFNF